MTDILAITKKPLRRTGRTRFFAVASAFTCLIAVAASASAAQLKEARVTQVVNDVKLLPGQAAPRPAVVNDNLRSGTAVRTGADSRTELTFTDLTLARLGANTIFSFNEGTRTLDLGSGAVLFQVPKGAGGAKITTAAVTAAITGTTGIGEFHPATTSNALPFSKWLCLEGRFHLYLANGQIKVEPPFQAKPLAEGESVAGGGGMKFADASRPRDRGCHCGGSDFRAARAFGHLKEHGAAAEIESARTFIKAKNRVRSEARQGQVGKRKLGA